MKEGLDNVKRKIQTLTAKVKNQDSTADGFSYLEAKNLLLLNYCQSLVYYLLRKAKGYSIEEHPVVRSIVEIRLCLEKVCYFSCVCVNLVCLHKIICIWHSAIFTQIRPIDKKQQYQIQKLIKASESATSNTGEKEPPASKKSEDVSKYRPNPDMLVSKVEPTAEVSSFNNIKCKFFGVVIWRKIYRCSWPLYLICLCYRMVMVMVIMCTVLQNLPLHLWIWRNLQSRKEMPAGETKKCWNKLSKVILSGQWWMIWRTDLKRWHY